MINLRFKDAIVGKIVSKEYLIKHPCTTIREIIKPQTSANNINFIQDGLY